MTLLPALSHGQGIPVDLSPSDIMPNFVGLGLGSTPSWHGADDSITGAAPGARIKLDHGRFVEWYGPYLGVNLLNSDNGWEAGPIASYRFGRQDTGNRALDALPGVDGGWDVGGYLGYSDISLLGPLPVRWRAALSASTGVSSDNPGLNASLFGSAWLPLSRSTFVGLGGGVSWSDDERMQLLFSVDQAHSAASGLDAFEAGAGIRQKVAWAGVIHQLTPRWLIGAMAYRQQLTNDAAQSPIVRDQGEATQWTYGVGLGYAF